MLTYTTEVDLPFKLSLNNNSHHYELISIVTATEADEMYRVYNRSGSEWFCYQGCIVYKVTYEEIRAHTRAKYVAYKMC